MNPSKITIATRAAPLAIRQSEIVSALLQSKNPGLTVEFITLTTEGDKRLEQSLAKIGGKGLFIKELEIALLNKTADCAVHSMKDMPAILPETLYISSVLEREDPRDTLVSNHYSDLLSLPKNAIVGTSSLRRECFVKAIRPDIHIKLLRGNVQTRLKKLDSGEYDAIILAAAGLHRLGLTHRISEYLDPNLFNPAPGQGIVGIECLKDHAASPLFESLNNTNSAICITAERAVAKALSASCHTPLSAFATLQNNLIHLTATLADPENYRLITSSQKADLTNAEELGKSVADELLSKGAQGILEKL